MANMRLRHIYWADWSWLVTTDRSTADAQQLAARYGHRHRWLVFSRHDAAHAANKELPS